MDTGCNRSVAGRKWTDKYIAAFGEKDKEESQDKGSHE